MKNQKLNYAWLILIGCCALTGGAAGIFLNCAGIFFGPVTSEIGCTTAELSIYFTLLGLGQFIMGPFVGKILNKFNTNLLLTVCYLVCALAIGLMSIYTKVWMWWISGALLGICGAFVLLIPTPIILGNWFAKKSGTMIGLAMAFSGIAGAIANPIFSSCIVSFGWRKTYLIMAIVSAVIVLPFTLFVLKLKPEQKGLKPYGYEEESVDSAKGMAVDMGGIPENIAKKSYSFIALFLAFGLIAVFNALYQLFPTYAIMAGRSASIGALMVSCYSVSNVVVKLGLGALTDKLGALKSCIICLVAAIIGYALLLTAGGSVIMAYAGAVLFGASVAVQSVGIPVLARNIFGNKDFGKIYPTLTMGMNLIGAFGLTILSTLLGATGSFTAICIISIAGTALIIFLMISSYNRSKKLTWEK